jgi:hypothetical protein
VGLSKEKDQEIYTWAYRRAVSGKLLEMVRGAQANSCPQRMRLIEDHCFHGKFQSIKTIKLKF